MYKQLLRPLLFQFDPEAVHHFTAAALQSGFALPLVPGMADAAWQVKHPSLVRTLFGLTFPNPVGLAAGFDKDARMIEAFAHLGFGFVEIGTLTPKPQPGNPKPRLFRLPADQAIINRMGFNNEGVMAAARRLEKRKSNVLVGGNIGKNKDTPNEEAGSDYLTCLQVLHDLVDYFVVNVSSPNTPGLRALQDKEPLLRILLTLQEENHRRKNPRPLLLKIAPDLTEEQLHDIIEIAQEANLAGVIATNTTVSRSGLVTPDKVVTEMGAGGLSGKPLRERAGEVCSYLRKHLPANIAIIGVGGIMTGADGAERLDQGADLVQLYTGFIYEGPNLVKSINRLLVEKAEKAYIR